MLTIKNHCNVMRRGKPRYLNFRLDLSLWESGSTTYTLCEYRIVDLPTSNVLVDQEGSRPQGNEGSPPPGNAADK